MLVGSKPRHDQRWTRNGGSVSGAGASLLALHPAHRPGRPGMSPAGARWSRWSPLQMSDPWLNPLRVFALGPGSSQFVPPGSFISVASMLPFF
jgi:hypothetical protein